MTYYLILSFSERIISTLQKGFPKSLKYFLVAGEQENISVGYTLLLSEQAEESSNREDSRCLARKVVVL